MTWDGIDRRRDERRHLSWWNGNQTRIWRIVVVGYMALLGFLGSWVFSSLIELPKIYATRVEINCLTDKVDNGFERLGDKIDRNFKFYVREIKKGDSE
ncbi:MAG: hypothetical protein V2I62_04245 [Bacteroidales bacterium]|jgi:hypothetical protein|nr:hypothetical protein [Bacteroidales bacterium]